MKHVETKDFVCDLCPEDGHKNSFSRLDTLKRHKRVQHNSKISESNAARSKPRSLAKRHNMGINKENPAKPKPNKLTPEGNTIFLSFFFIFFFPSFDSLTYFFLSLFSLPLFLLPLGFPCEVCNLYFTRKDNLKAHNARHDGKSDSVRCQFCAKLMSKKTIVAHVRKFHPN